MTKKTTKTKSPYKNYTVAEVMLAESSTYFIQVGIGLFDHDGEVVFSKKMVALHYNKILNNLLDMLDGGDDGERDDAMRCLETLQIHPLRIH